jgi:hypothetical protein
VYSSGLESISASTLIYRHKNQQALFSDNFYFSFETQNPKTMNIKLKIAVGLLIAQWSAQAQSITLNPSDTKNILTVQSTNQAIKLPVLNESQRNLLPSPVIGMQVYCSNCLAGVGAYAYNGSAWAPMFVPPTSDLPSYTVGQLAQGGRIFFVDETGRHGLAAATLDQAASIKWAEGNFHITSATRVGVYGGLANTKDIVRIEENGSYAAKVAQSTTDGGFGDWHLPSLEELRLMYIQKNVIGGFTNANYWSSTEISGTPATEPSTTAFAKDFTSGAEAPLSKASNATVRAIRKF